jgi:predicted flap endonuclease-1-like 5' DNA nuclease
MLRGLLRLLVRLFFFGLIAGAVGFVVTRLMGGEDEDFEDFDDLESSFEFNETPVEIEVSDTDTAGTTSSPSTRARVVASSEAHTKTAADEIGADTTAVSDGPRLIDIKGIGPQYETRLHSMGIKTMQDLIDADANHVAEEIGVIGGTAQVEEWVEQAHAFLSDKQG